MTRYIALAFTIFLEAVCAAAFVVFIFVALGFHMGIIR